MSDAETRKAVSLDLGGGGWVLLLAGALCLGVISWRAASWRLGSRAQGDGADPASYGFDLSGLTVPRGALAAGAIKDGLPRLEARLIDARAGAEFRLGHGRLLVSGDRVLGLELAGEACALPLRVLQWHEAVELELGGRSLLVSYSGLTDGARVYEREVGGAARSFGVSGLLASATPLLYDRQPGRRGESLWRQLDGVAVAGPAAAAGLRLRPVPAQLVHWQDWLREHPATRVLAPDLERGKLYRRDPWAHYAGTSQIPFPVVPAPPAGLAPKTRVLVVTAGGERRVYPFSWVAARADDEGRLQLTQGAAALELRLRRDPEGVEPEVIRVRGPADLDAFSCYWFAWHAASPGDAPVE